MSGKTAARLGAAGLFAFFAIPLVASWVSFAARGRALLAGQTQAMASELADRFGVHLRARLAVVGSLAREVAASEALRNAEGFEMRARSALGALPGFQALNWVDERGVIAVVVPSEGNEGALGKSVLESPAARSAFLAARARRQPTITPPLSLFQGGRGIASYFPIGPEAGGHGYLNAVFRIESLARSAVSPTVARLFSVSLADASGGLFREGEPAAAARSLAREASVEVYGRRWSWTARPSLPLLQQARGGWGIWLLWGGLALDFVASIAFHQYLRSRRAGLERERRLEASTRALIELAQCASSGAPRLLAPDLTRHACRAIDADLCVLWHLEPGGGGEFRAAVAYDARAGEHGALELSLPMAAVAAWPGVVASRPFVVDDVRREPTVGGAYRQHLASLKMPALLAIGVRSGQTCVALLTLHRRAPHRGWSPEDELVARHLADLVSLREEEGARARAEAELEATVERLTATNGLLQQAARLVAGLSSNERGVARELTRLCAEGMDVSRVALWRCVPKTTTVRMVSMFDATTGRFVEALELDSRDYPEYWEALRADGRIVTQDARTDARTKKLFERHLPRQPPVALLDVAVRLRGEVAGLFSFHKVGLSRAWSAEDEILVSAVADLLALHFERGARRQAEQKLTERASSLARQAEALARVSQLVAERPDPSTATRHLARWGAWALGATSASAWLKVGGSEVHELASRYVLAEDRFESGDRFSADAAVAYRDRILRERSVAISDGARDPTYAPVHAALFSEHREMAVLAAAVRSEGQVVGLMSLLVLGATRKWTVEEELFVGALADSLSLVLESSARERTEQERRRSQRRLELLIEGTPLAAIDWDSEGRVVGWNPAAQRIFGFSRQEALGNRGDFLFPEEMRESLAAALKERFAGRATFAERFRNRRKDGRELLCDWRSTVLHDHDDQDLGVTSLVEDVTERVATERRVRELNAGLEKRVEERTADLEQANSKLRELDRLKTEFLATMSHELRTPLNSIIGFSGLLSAGMAGEINEEQARQLDMIGVSARHLLGLITDLLDLSRIEAGRMRLGFSEFSPGQVLEEVHHTLLPLAAERGLEFRLSRPLPEARWCSDRSRVFQILVNLANNAIKFTRAGRVDLRLVADSEGGARFEVQDTGPGIAHEKVNWIFEAFRQLDGSARRQHEGTGLGLYLSRKLAHLLGGELEVDSTPGAGSTFSLVLPAQALWLGPPSGNVGEAAAGAGR